MTAPPPEPLELPDRQVFWRWVADAVRPVVGWALAGLGALSLLLGWIGVSGESLTAKQLPYLVSGGLTGIALVVLAAAFLATEDFRRQMGRLDDLERKVADLYTLFVDDLAAAAGAPSAPKAAGDAPVALPTGSSYHRPDCPLVAGKTAAVTADTGTIHRRHLTPCRVCDPTPVPAGRSS